MDTGYVEESRAEPKKSGATSPLEDMVRVIRTFRPQVVINGWGGVHSGHGQHQASGILTPQAVAAAADPKMFPEQIAEGLPAWKVTLDSPANSIRRREPNVTWRRAAVPVQRRFAALGRRATSTSGMRRPRANHRSQGTPMAFFRQSVFPPPGLCSCARTKKATLQAGYSIRGSWHEPLEAIGVLRGAPLRVDAASRRIRPRAAASRALLRSFRTAAKHLAEAAKVIAELHELASIHNAEGSAQLLWELDRVREKIDLALERGHRAPH